MFGQNLAKIRKSRKLSQYDLAEKMGFSRGQIANYEQGTRQPDFETLQKFADFFEVSTDYLLGRTDNPNPIQDLAAHRSDDHMDDLPEEAIREVENFKAFIRSKYGKQNNKGNV